ncbi:hypothetical protein RRG08_026251 [Elysia crispata]|uniref:Uncharacterized protein n=1 Tax=Elysia crispata TaxID=231223 RepID=A0AAE1DDC3_9GAST|nr:hypothetical protein RRG08_026251 [Elysia crispata]
MGVNPQFCGDNGSRAWESAENSESTVPGTQFHEFLFLVCCDAATIEEICTVRPHLILTHHQREASETTWSLKHLANVSPLKASLNGWEGKFNEINTYCSAGHSVDRLCCDLLARLFS